MQNYISDVNFEKVLEGTPLTKFSTRDERWKILQKATIGSSGQRKSLPRERSQSLYSFGDNLKKRQNLLSLAISEYPDAPEKKRSTVTLPKTSRPSKRFRRLNALLLEAVRSQDVSEIEKLIIAGANPNATCCAEDISACHLAAMRPDGALALLLSHGADKLRSDRLGRTPLHLAAWAGNVRQVAMLLGFSKDLTNRVSLSMMTPEVEEEVKNLSQFIKELVNVKCSNFTQDQAVLPKEWSDNSIDHNCKEFDKSLPLLESGWTPLHAASYRAKSDCTQLLLAAGAHPCVRDLIGRSPLDIAGSSYYSNDNIDPQRFAETILLLTGDKAHFSIKNRKILDTPLHTAVELDSLEAVRALLSVGVPVDWLNRTGLTPLHISVKKKLGDILQVLIHDKLNPEENKYADIRDKDGCSVLQAAVMEGWEHGVSIALEAGVNIIIKDFNHDTALHLAAAIGNLNILNKIIDAVKPKSLVHEKNLQGETPLMKAVINGHIECVKRLLEEKSSIRQPANKVNVFHLAAEKGFVEVLQVLLDHDYILTREMINFLTDDKDGFGPIHYAVQNNHPQCVKVLLSKNGFRCLKTSLTGVYNGSTPLHIAAKHNNVEIAKIIIKNNPDTVHKLNGQNWTPLHTASNYGSRDMIELLLKEGADLSCLGQIKEIGTTPIDLIMNNLSNPTEFMNHIFDKYIYTNDTYIQDPNCEVTVNFQILVPIPEEKQEMKVIEALLKTGDRYEQTHLLVHPLLESFLDIKWKALLPFIYGMILTYGVYVMYLTTYVMLIFFYKDNGIVQPTWLNQAVLAIILYLVSFFAVALEVCYININKRYFLQLETWVKFGSIILALSLPSTIVNTEPNVDYPRYIATVSLLLSWLEMMFLLSRFPTWGYYVLMFGKVSYNVLKVLLTFSFLVVGFSISFMVMFRHQSPFENPWAALVKTLVMLTSEYDYGDLMEQVKTVDGTNNTTSTESFIKNTFQSLLLVRLIFLIFLILAGIVLMNLMVGVAVNDLQNLQLIGNIRRLTKQIEFHLSLNRSLYNRFLSKILPKDLLNTLLNSKTIDTTLILRPSEPNSKTYKALPSDIRNAIFEKAQVQKKRMEEEIGTQIYKKKLDEIYGAIMKIQENTISNEVENFENPVADVDAEVVDCNNHITEILKEMRSSINTLELKVDMILNRLQSGQSNQAKSYLKIFKSDKP
ncbi:unnamed protein product [Arctia plantaginis]|uniref:Ion transport domain-containing protein n=1 Tax=Arctia plantaginis TaxID=874455 RepID=A0A8S1B4W9_ARCPL|nr:unnamed protein product [Arctia plantaginis]